MSEEQALGRHQVLNGGQNAIAAAGQADMHVGEQIVPAMGVCGQRVGDLHDPGLWWHLYQGQCALVRRPSLVIGRSSHQDFSRPGDLVALTLAVTEFADEGVSAGARPNCSTSPFDDCGLHQVDRPGNMDGANQVLALIRHVASIPSTARRSAAPLHQAV
jgi:hypothetical protein